MKGMIAAFEARGVVWCGGRGEYHTLVTDGPLFHVPLAVRYSGVRVDGDSQRGGLFRQLDLHLIEDA